MMRSEVRCWTLLLLLGAQIIFMFYYVLVTAPLSESEHSWAAISFVHPEDKPLQHQTSNSHFANIPFILPNLDRRKYFGILNKTQCFLPGTDIRFSKKFLDCECLPGWHGPDCGLPEVMWRAFITARHKKKPKRRETLRRIICCVTSQAVSSTFTEILIQELNSVVDLFIVAQANKSSTISLPETMQHKTLIIHLLEQGINFPWHEIREHIPNLKHDDIIIFISDNQIPISKALLFLKLYDGWPEPIAFRLRWSVFGFFWQHPKQTILGGTVTTASVLAKQYGDSVNKLFTREQSLLIIGDLNHFGGWECSWCFQTPQEIITNLQVIKPKDWDISNRKIDTAYIEDLIGNGIWVDGKTQLLRSSPSRDQYFAPNCVLNSSWKYDFLTQNMYTQIDY